MTGHKGKNNFGMRDLKMPAISGHRATATAILIILLLALSVHHGFRVTAVIISFTPSGFSLCFIHRRCVFSFRLVQMPSRRYNAVRLPVSFSSISREREACV